MIGPFWHFVRMLLERRGAVVIAILCASISAASMGSGLVVLGPILEIVLGEARGLAEVVQSFFVQYPSWTPPAALIDLLPSTPRGSLAFLLGGLALLTVIGASANFMHQYFSVTLCAGVVARVRQEAFDRSIRLPLATVVARGPAEYTSRILRDAGDLQTGLSTLIGKMLAQLLKGVAAFAAAIWFDWRLTLFALLVGPVVAIILRKAGKRIRRGIRGSLEAQQGLLRVAGEALQGLRTVKAMGAEEQMGDRFGRLNQEAYRQEMRARLARALASPLIEMIAIVVAAGLAYLAGVQILDGHARFEDFVLAMGSLAAMGSSLRPVAVFINELSAANAPSSRLLEILHAPSEFDGDERRAEAPASWRVIELVDASIRYPGASVDAVHCLTLSVRAGEHLAIVGPNGCGKSTLLAGLARLVPLATGSLSVDGVNLDGTSLASWRRQAAMVAQEPFLMAGSIEENIRLGRPNATRAEVVDAAKRAHAMEFILRLPGGLEAQVSELGSSLSGGQRQRIAIARAALAGPALLLLDEATSQVDAESDVEIAAAIRDIGQGRTVVTVAHRFASVVSADRIVVMDQGSVIDIGTHEELLERCGLYARLARAQFMAAG